MTKKKLTLNSAFIELERIVDEFEEGKIDLEKSLDKFKEGLEIAKFLKKRLARIENEIEEIKKDYDLKDDDLLEAKIEDIDL